MESLKEIIANPEAGRDQQAGQELKQALELTTGPAPNDSINLPTSLCPDCRGEGLVLRDGKRYRCHCRTEAIIRYLLPVRYHEARLADFGKGLMEAVTDWLDKPTDGLFLMGGAGTGKTHLAAGIVRYQVARGRRAIFKRAAQLFQALRDSYGKEGITEESILHDYIEAPLLILDDLGAGSLSDHERRSTLEILDRRMNAMLSTVVTSNWNVAAISERMDERVGSRLATYKLISFEGEDKRTA